MLAGERDVVLKGFFIKKQVQNMVDSVFPLLIRIFLQYTCTYISVYFCNLQETIVTVLHVFFSVIYQYTVVTVFCVYTCTVHNYNMYMYKPQYISVIYQYTI